MDNLQWQGEVTAALAGITERLGSLELILRQRRDDLDWTRGLTAERAASVLSEAERRGVTPETVMQGYLAGRWKRRRGDGYRGMDETLEEAFAKLEARVTALEQPKV
jgi:hypothetical protein